MLRLHAGSSQTMVRSVVRTKVSEKQGYPIRMRTYVAPNFVTNFAQMLDLGSNLRTNMHPACFPPRYLTPPDMMATPPCSSFYIFFFRLQRQCVLGIPAVLRYLRRHTNTSLTLPRHNDSRKCDPLTFISKQKAYEKIIHRHQTGMLVRCILETRVGVLLRHMICWNSWKKSEKRVWDSEQVYKSSSSSGRGTASACERFVISVYPRVMDWLWSYLSQLLAVLGHQRRVNLDLSRGKGGSSDEVESGVSEKNFTHEHDSSQLV